MTRSGPETKEPRCELTIRERMVQSLWDHYLGSRVKSLPQTLPVCRGHALTHTSQQLLGVDASPWWAFWPYIIYTHGMTKHYASHRLPAFQVGSTMLNHQYLEAKASYNGHGWSLSLTFPHHIPALWLKHIVIILQSSRVLGHVGPLLVNPERRTNFVAVCFLQLEHFFK